jgi:3-dehydroquinate dehydratase-2
MKFLVLNGPNINMLSIREPDIYGKQDYPTLVKMIEKHAGEIGAEVECFQSNSEGALIDKIQEAYFKKVDGIVFNPAAYTHTSIALHDALKAVSIPTVEVHISDVSKREKFRQISYISSCSVKTIAGHGLAGYLEAMDFLKEYLSK